MLKSIQAAAISCTIYDIVSNETKIDKDKYLHKLEKYKC